MTEGQGRDLLRALAVASAVAVPISLVALGFLAVVEHMTDVLWHELPLALGFAADAWWWVLDIPTVGGLLAGLAVRYLPGRGGHHPMAGFSASPIEPRAVAGVALAALASLPFGAVLGPEAPLVALGGGLAMWASHVFRQTGNVATLAASAGLFAAIAALFGNPLIAAFLVLEAVGVAAVAAPLTAVILPGLLAAGLGYVVFTGIGEFSGITLTPITVQGLAAYESLRLADLGWAVLIGLAMAAIGLAVQVLSVRVYRVAAARPLVATPIGGLAIGGLALAFGASGESPLLVLFSGQHHLSDVVVDGEAWGPGILALLVLAKAGAYAVSQASGFRGGPVFPALFLGVAVGTGVSLVVPGLATTPAVVAGMAAGAAAALRLPVASVMLAVLIAGSAGLQSTTLAIVGAVTATVVTMAAHARWQTQLEPKHLEPTNPT